MDNKVQVGVSVILTYNNTVLIGERIGSHGANKLAFPGGHLEFGESWEECAIREVNEETGLNLNSCKYEFVTNDYMKDENKHYITIFMKAEIENPSDIINAEPDKCKGWVLINHKLLYTSKYKDLLFLPIKNLINSTYKFT